MYILHPAAVGTEAGKSAKRRRCHVADATSDTVKPLEMENITELWSGGEEEGRREGRGVFTRRVMLRSTSPSGCDPLFHSREDNAPSRGASTEREGSVKLCIDTRGHRSGWIFSYFVIRRLAISSRSRLVANVLTRITTALTSGFLLLRPTIRVLREIWRYTRMRQFHSNANYDSIHSAIWRG